MKKSSFVALILGTVSGILFALGMCMALLPGWNAFTEGVIFGSIGLVLGSITAIIWFKMEKKRFPKLNPKIALRTLYLVMALLLLGTGMSMCMVMGNFIWGTLVGLLGIVMLISLIPMIKGIK